MGKTWLPITNNSLPLANLTPPLAFLWVHLAHSHRAVVAVIVDAGRPNALHHPEVSDAPD
jgi:hypothetical protein